MKVVKSPEVFDQSLAGDAPTVFLAGGITNCPDWQDIVPQLLKEYDITFFNPRRDHFDITKDDPISQIQWEFDHLTRADIL